MGDDKKRNEKGGKRRDAESESAYSPDADGAMSGDEAAITPSLPYSLTHSLTLVKPKLSLSFQKSPWPVKNAYKLENSFYVF